MDEVQVLRFGRHGGEWAAAVLRSPPALKALALGVDVTPPWANGAKILIEGLSAAVFLSRAIHLQAYHVVLRASDIPDFQEFLQHQLSYSHTPRVRQAIPLGPATRIQTWTWEQVNTFVHVPSSGPSSTGNLGLETRTASTTAARDGQRNVRQVSVGDTRHGPTMTLEQHGGKLKKLQAKRDLPMVIQAFSDILRDSLTPDAYCYTIVIDTCAELADQENAELWMQKMDNSGIPCTAISYQCVMKACANAKHPDDAERWFHRMQEEGHQPTTVSYNLLISAYTERMAEASAQRRSKGLPNFDKALHFFNELCSKIFLRPTRQTYASFINAYAQFGRPSDALVWLDEKIRAGFPQDVQDCGMIMNAYANVGVDHDSQPDLADIDEAEAWHNAIFRISGRLEVYNFTPLLKACARAKEPTRAEEIFRRQIRQGVRPDHFNLQTLRQAVGGTRLQTLCADNGIDAGAIHAEFIAVGDEMSFDNTFLKRKTWKIDYHEGCRNRNNF